MSNSVTLQMEYHNGTLSVVNKEQYKEFLSYLEEGQRVECFINVINADKSLAQLNKVHKMIRVLAQETGTTFEYMKCLVKDRCGLKVGDTYKSFADLSKDEMSTVIEELKELFTFNGLKDNE